MKNNRFSVCRCGRLVLRTTVCAVLTVLCTCGLFRKEGTVTLTQAEAGIRIDNGTFLDIRYVLGEEDYIASITWWAGDDSWPKVDAEDAVIKKFTEIPNGESYAVGPDDRIVMFWWDREYEDAEDLHKLTLDIK